MELLYAGYGQIFAENYSYAAQEMASKSFLFFAGAFLPHPRIYI
jgi:hypothetical protein